MSRNYKFPAPKELVDKYTRWKADWRTLTRGQQHMLDDIDFSTYPSPLTQGQNVNHNVDLQMPGNTGGTILVRGQAAFDLTTNINGGGQSLIVNIEGSFPATNFTSTNSFNFHTTGQFTQPITPGVHYPTPYYRIFLTNILR